MKFATNRTFHHPYSPSVSVLGAGTRGIANDFDHVEVQNGGNKNNNNVSLNREKWLNLMEQLLSQNDVNEDDSEEEENGSGEQRRLEGHPIRPIHTLSRCEQLSHDNGLDTFD